MFQKGYGLRDLFRNIARPIRPILKPVLKEAKGIGMAVGADLAQNGSMILLLVKVLRVL